MPLTRLFLALVLAVPLPAAALSFSGSFAGIARVSNILDGDDAAFYDGAEVTGTFSADIPDAHLAAFDRTTYNGLGGGRTELTFTMRGRTFSFPGRDLEWYGALMTLGDATPDHPTQGLTFHDVWFGLKYQGAWFSLSSPPETLFRDDDYTTLRVAPDTVTGFDAFFKDAASSLYVDVDIRSFAIAPAPPVPEPASWALLSLGLAAVAAGARTRPAP